MKMRRFNITNQLAKFSKKLLISFYVHQRYRYTMYYFRDKPEDPPNVYELSYALGGYFGFSITFLLSGLFQGLAFFINSYIVYIFVFSIVISIIVAYRFIKRLGGEKYVENLSEKFLIRYKLTHSQGLRYMFLYLFFLFVIMLFLVSINVY